MCLATSVCTCRNLLLSDDMLVGFWASNIGAQGNWVRPFSCNDQIPDPHTCTLDLPSSSDTEALRLA